MLRFKIMASVVPLAVAAVFAQAEFLPGPRPCIEVSGSAVQIAPVPWQAQLHVSFTSDPSLATVRVQISDNAEAADFTVIDDIDDAEAGACETNMVSTMPRPAPARPTWCRNWSRSLAARRGRNR
jgi:hypothetical protein